MTAIELKSILASHTLWLEGDSKGVRAGANLSGANLCGANLYGANLGSADLRSADLRSADLRSADLRSANLSSANLCGANLGSASLYGANLGSADLRSADLRSADLRSADLCGANLCGANLCGANLYGANLGSADLRSAILPAYQIVPEVGPFYAFKKLQNGVIATLYIPRSAQRLNTPTDRKCRVSKAKVVALTGGTKSVAGIYDGNFVYAVGAWVKPDSFNDDIREVCTHGIHCFITRKEAEDYS